MIEYANEAVRQAFHSLSIDKQREWIQVAESFLRRGKFIRMLYVEQFPDGNLEVSIRIDEKSDIPA